MPETSVWREPEPQPVVDRIDGRYRKIDMLGEGGMGAVWKIEDEQTGRELVLKVLHSDFTTYEHAVERFKREIKILGKINNPFVVKAHDVVLMKPVRSDDGGVDIGVIMEYVEGKDLFDTLRSERFFDEKRAANVAIQICLGLAGTHEAGVVHRDLKSENIFLDKQGYVRVGDFGIARLYDELSQVPLPKGAREVDRIMKTSSERALTVPGVVFGTPEYIAPELARGGTQIDGRADLYSLGIIMYRMLSGHLPFSGGGKLALTKRQIRERPKAFSELDMPEENEDTVLAPVVMKLLEKSPENRYQTANETARAIAHIILSKYPELAHDEPYCWLGGTEKYARKRTPRAEAA